MEQDRLIASHIIERVSPSVEILVFCYFRSDLFDQSYTSFLYSTKIKEQNRKLTAGCSKYSFEVADKTDVVLGDFRRVLRKNNMYWTIFCDIIKDKILF